MKKLIVLGAALVALLTLAVFVAYRFVPAEAPKDGRLFVVASFYPLAEFARQIGGEHVLVETIIPPGVEPHDFEPTPRAVARIYGADLFITNGGIDAWAEQLISEAGKRGVATLEMRGVMDNVLQTGGKEHDDATYDAHFWLDPHHAEKMVTVIADAFIWKDEAHAETYWANAEAYVAELRALDRAYADGLAICERRAVVASHASLGYIADAYHFESLSIAGLSPDAEPSAGALATLAREAQVRGIRHVFFETLVSPKLAETLAHEIGAETLVFNPLEGLTDEERASGASYFSVMRENLVNLRTAMVCQ